MAATHNGDLVINYSTAHRHGPRPSPWPGTMTAQSAGTGVERINFNGATYAGYLLGPDDYLVSRLDQQPR